MFEPRRKARLNWPAAGWEITPRQASSFQGMFDWDYFRFPMNLTEKPGTILLVEDSEDDVIIIRRAFEQGAIPNPLTVVRDGEEAVAYLNGDGKYEDRRSYPLPVLV